MRPTLRALSSLPLILTLAVPAAAQQIPTDALSQLSFRHIGPVGNRTTS
ncbi:MAG: hypothetical protein HOE14_03255, partial [Gemmatimonadales bacterium]|nr:hypothetical protein [Gemmatimonadales bacterium]